jgi:hypothetical protein
VNTIPFLYIHTTFDIVMPQMFPAQGVTTYSHGNVCIVAYVSNNIHRLRSTGTFIGIILKEEDIDYPITNICEHNSIFVYTYNI